MLSFLDEGFHLSLSHLIHFTQLLYLLNFLLEFGLILVLQLFESGWFICFLPFGCLRQLGAETEPDAIGFPRVLSLSLPLLFFERFSDVRNNLEHLETELAVAFNAK